MIQFFLGGRQLSFASWPPDGVHILDLVLESLQGAFFSQCLQNACECVSSFVRLTTLLLPECLLGDLWFMFCHESSPWRSAYISSRPWPMRCASTSLSKRFTSRAMKSAPRELRSGWWSNVECLLEVVWEWIRAECYFSSRAVMGRHRIWSKGLFIVEPWTFSWFDRHLNSLLEHMILILLLNMEGMIVLWCLMGRSIFVGRSCRQDIFVF